jgi:hypothetical protein
MLHHAYFTIKGIFMRILILGAGSSMPAEYPSADALIPAVGKFVEENPDALLKEYWRRWDSWRSNTELPAKIVFNPNPEVVLSLPDLYEAATKSADLAEMHEVLEKYRAGNLTEEELRDHEKYYKSEERKRSEEVQRARIGFIECLQRFFFYRHHLDARHREQRDYLRQHFARLSRGDLVITLNWDTTAERTLAEEGLWNPISGYGFKKELRAMPYVESLSPDLNTESKVIVLKLHGSIGWHTSDSNDVYFDQPRFLHEFNFCSNGKPLSLMDPDAPRGRPAEDPVLLYPSYLKQLKGPVMQQIWHLAGEALREAQRVEVYGYSLPESDLAVRTLFNVLRFRAESGALRVLVHDPGAASRERWEAFLGRAELVDGRRIEEEPPAD